MTLRLGIVGCGLIGRKRAASVGVSARVTVCSDLDEERAKSLAATCGAAVARDWREVVELSDVDAVIVATRHDTLAEISAAAVATGKHVFVEKPAALRARELEKVIDAARRSGAKVRVGFNHRYHRALRKAMEIVRSGALGDLFYLRARYGHGGRLGYEKEWRAQPAVSGGGELIDQGPHLIDLARWFLGEFSEVSGFAHTYFWDMPVDDNGFMLLKTPRKQVAFLHVSCTEWKNLFSLELFGRDGKLEVSGLGGSYGVERLTWYRMLPEMGPPETVSWEYPMADNSWEVELAEFFEDIRQGRDPSCGLQDAIQALAIVERIYEVSRIDHRT